MSTNKLLRSFEIPISSKLPIPNHITYLLNSCSSLKHLKQIHATIITNGSSQELLIVTKLIELARGLSSNMSYARKMFDRIPDRDVFLWNTLIRGYADLGPCEEAIMIYKDMHFNGLLPDHYTFPSVVRSCAVLSALREGKEVHCGVIKNGFGSNVFVQSSLVSMYCQSGEMSDSEMVFDEMGEKNVVSWTAMVAGYVQNGFLMKGLGVFRRMVDYGVQPNEVTLVSVLPACAGLELTRLGEYIHGYGIKLGMDSDISLINALISFYGKCRSRIIDNVERDERDERVQRVKRAQSIFDKIEVRKLVSWNAMIAVYEQNDMADGAINLFKRMRKEKVEFDYITLVTVISACARSGILNIGIELHDLATGKGLETNLSVTNALIDMYAKCGCIDLARKVFERLPERTVVSWTTMIGACATNGFGNDALEFFESMLEEKVMPNSFTFIAVLTACRHSGLIEEGRKHFESMRNDYSIVPGVEHCACMVDLLGRGGQLREAFEFIERMPVEPDVGVWGALLSACKIHRNLKMAEVVAERLFELNPQATTPYILMSNIYDEAGRWEDGARLRDLMEERKMKKVPGRSSVEVNRRLHTFLSGSKSRPS